VIIFLDDNPERHKRFLRAHIGECVWQAYTAPQAIELLSKHKTTESDEIWLDHDLNGEVFVDSNRSDTGFEVVRWICSNLPNIKCPIFVHSLNDEAAPRMVQALQAVGYESDWIPFHF
jgi:hypothetical protein